MSQPAVLPRAEPTPAAAPTHTPAPSVANLVPDEVAEPDAGLRLSLTHDAGNTVVVHVRGSLDAWTTPRLATLLTPRLECAAGVVVLDLSEVEFVCTAAVGLLVHARLRAASRGLALRLVSGPRCLERALHAACQAGASTFTTYPDVPAALANSSANEVEAKR